jgi:hypothetical protein
LDALSELASALTGSSRAILIAEADVDLRPGAPSNRLFLFKIGEGSLAAGGRGGGFGERRVTAVLCFERNPNGWSKVFEAEEEQLEQYEVPYHVSRLPMVLPDGTETMGYGVVDPELVTELAKKSGIASPA